MHRTAVIALLFALMPAPSAAQDPEAARISFEPSSADIARDAALISGVARGAHRLLEIGLDRLLPRSRDDGATGIALRVARLYLVSLPVASLSHTLIHEAGHGAYTRRAGGRHDFTITQWPWPVPLTFARGTSTHGVWSLGTIAGGSEAAFVHESLQADAIYESDRTHYYNWVAYAYAKLDTLTYVQTSLDEGGEGFDEGDPLSFVLLFEAERRIHEPPVADTDTYFGLLNRARAIRRQSWWALADLTLVSAVVRTLQYVWTGQRFSSPFAFALGGTRIVPGWHFVLTPAGYEHRGSARFRRGGHRWLVYGRHINAPSRDDLDGLGGWWSTTLRSTVRLAAHVDGWRTVHGSRGYRIGLGLRRQFSRLSGLEVGGSLGYKTFGYLEGHPMKSGVIVGVSGALRF